MSLGRYFQTKLEAFLACPLPNALRKYLGPDPRANLTYGDVVFVAQKRGNEWMSCRVTAADHSRSTVAIEEMFSSAMFPERRLSLGDSEDNNEPFEVGGYTASFRGTDGWRISDQRGNRMETPPLRTRQDAASFMAGQVDKLIQ